MSSIYLNNNYKEMKLTNLSKKLLAAASVSAIVATSVLNTVVFGANVDDATASVTLGAGNDVISVTVPSYDFNAHNVARVLIKDNSGTTVYSNTGVDVNYTTGFEINSVDFAGILTGGTRYTVSFEATNTPSNDVGAAVLVVNNDNQIVVSAKVDPVLKFAIQSTGFNLGVLSSNYSEVTGGLEVGSNATAGITVVASSQQGGLSSANASHVIGHSGNESLYNQEDYGFYSVESASPDSIVGATIAGVAATSVNTASQNVTVYTANKPQNFDTASWDTNFTVRAKIAESTPAAADYTDTITFTVTGNF